MGGHDHCSVINCSNRRGPGNSFSFHRYPANAHRKRLWVIASHGSEKYFNVTSHSRICSAHFVGGKPVNDKNHVDYVPTVNMGREFATVSRITTTTTTTTSRKRKATSNLVKKGERRHLCVTEQNKSSEKNLSAFEIPEIGNEVVCECDESGKNDSKMDEYGSEASDSSTYMDTGEQDPDSVPAQSNKPGQSEPKSGHSTTSNPTTEKETAEDTEQEDDFMDDIYEVDVKTPIFNNLAALLSSQAGSSKNGEDKLSVTSPIFASLISKILSPVGFSNKIDTQLSNHSNRLILHPETVNCKDSGDTSRPNKVQQQVYIKMLQEAVIIYPLKIFNPQHSNPNEVHTQPNKTCATSV